MLITINDDDNNNHHVAYIPIDSYESHYLFTAALLLGVQCLL